MALAKIAKKMWKNQASSMVTGIKAPLDKQGESGSYLTTYNKEHPIKVKAHGQKAETLFRAGLDHLQRILDILTG